MFERSEENTGAAVAETNPDERDWIVHFCCDVEKILVLADDCAAASARVATDFEIGCPSQADIENMFAIKSAITKKLAQPTRELVVDQKFHVVCKTT